jgi:hypothetical protein
MCQLGADGARRFVTKSGRTLFARPEWRVSAKASAHINDVERLELVGRRLAAFLPVEQVDVLQMANLAFGE